MTLLVKNARVITRILEPGVGFPHLNSQKKCTYGVCVHAMMCKYLNGIFSNLSALKLEPVLIILWKTVLCCFRFREHNDKKRVGIKTFF